MNGHCLNAIGDGLALLGILMLFRYGMPFRVPTGGGYMRVTQPTPEEAARELRWRGLGIVGLAFAVVGELAQLAANFLPSN